MLGRSMMLVVGEKGGFFDGVKFLGVAFFFCEREGTKPVFLNDDNIVAEVKCLISHALKKRQKVEFVEICPSESYQFVNAFGMIMFKLLKTSYIQWLSEMC